MSTPRTRWNVKSASRGALGRAWKTARRWSEPRVLRAIARVEAALGFDPEQPPKEAESTVERLSDRATDAPAYAFSSIGKAHRPNAGVHPTRFSRRILAAMPVLCSDGRLLAVVDRMEGTREILLMRDASGKHHYIPVSWVTAVDASVHLDRSVPRAMDDWSEIAANSHRT